MNNPYLILTPIVFTLLLSCNADTSNSNHSTPSNQVDTLIAYNVLVDPSTNNYDIYVTDLEGSKHTNISKNEWLDWAYSSYDEKLFVISDRDTCNRCYFLYETDTKGSQWTKISDIQVQDSWVDISQDGKRLIIKPFGKPNTPFQIIDRNGALISEVDPQMTYFNDPCFSTDGNNIVFRGYDDAKVDHEIEAELYLYNLANKTKSRLTHYPSDSKPVGDYRYCAGPPRWNDATNTISYSSSYDDLSVIKSIDANGKPSRNLTQKNVKAVWHDISSDGNWVAFDGQLDYKADKTTSQIFLMNTKKRSSKSITVGSGYKQGPVFVIVRK